MPEEKTISGHGGSEADGPAFGTEVLEEAGIPSLRALCAALEDSSDLVEECIKMTGNQRFTAGERSHAAMAAARLIAASAQTATAIARIADSGTRLQLASARMAQAAQGEKSTNECRSRLEAAPS